MSEHLTSATLTALADGELAAEELAFANDHLASCPACTSNALQQALLKTATAKAGHRYTPSQQWLNDMTRQINRSSLAQQKTPTNTSSNKKFLNAGWATAAAALVVASGLLVMQHKKQQSEVVSTQYAALVTEASDEHIAALASTAPPQVMSSDRHTVKPWFQGRIPFSFNLPDNLPQGITLDGADLTYLHNQPTAQLLYSIGRHHVSVFLSERRADSASSDVASDHAGFHVIGFHTNELDGVAVTDADPTRLSELVDLIRNAQTAAPVHP